MKYLFKNETDVATLKIYDYIGSYEGEISTDQVEQALNDANGKPLDVYVNSYGGEVFEGFAIYNMIKRYKGYKRVIVDGIAASIASVISLAGDKVIMNKASMMMIHNASGVAIGNAEEMKKVVQALEQINEVIRDVYKAKTGLDDEKLTELMDNETFMSADQCKEYGFCDDIVEEENDEEQTQRTMDKLIDRYNDRIKTLKEVKDCLENVSEGGDNLVIEEETFTNKNDHWMWLRKDK